ncbi:hypothetical protein BCON_0120g00090 [Botryotinia convoluta]|uniref:Uncharacterized protein n=1 Tax=Botryotinia convoluta TaxID=54673 RepID=A0A4Z1I2G6_9HELO|nr:hypothetical protein BCON_0120g00090 [Botryotinia convoluta]
MAVNHNHANYQSRLNTLNRYLQILCISQVISLFEHLFHPYLITKIDDYDQKLQQIKITPVQYKDDHPFKYNNFVYHLLLPNDTSGLQLPGCDDIPAGKREFIMRLSNPDSEDMHQDTRVQNEVGILTLARDALSRINPKSVYFISLTWVRYGGRYMP